MRYRCSVQENRVKHNSIEVLEMVKWDKIHEGCCVVLKLYETAIVIEQKSYDRIYVVWITRIGSTGPQVVWYWNTSKVKGGKIKNTLWKREQGKPVKQCNLTNQAKNTKQKEEK